MKTYAAQLNDNIVSEVIVGNYEWAIENIGGVWVDCTDNGELVAGVGYTFDGTDFVAPIVEESV